MSTILSHPSVVSTVRPTEPCWKCGQPSPSDGPHRCDTCDRSDAANEAHRLLADVNALFNGTDVFAVLPIADRVEQLAALGLPLEYITGRLSDTDLIDLTGTAQEPAVIAAASAALVDRLDNSPGSIERAAIERPTDYAQIDLTEFAGYRAV
jgi:hypothetical protein